MYRAISEKHVMTDRPHNSALEAIFPMVTKRLKRAHDVATAAECCAATGNYDGAFRILLDIEEDTGDATTLLNAASLIWRNKEN